MKVRVWKETFAIVKAKKPDSNAFANVVDKNEVTIVIDEAKLDEENVLAVDRGWKLLTFEAVLPLDSVGFLAKISRALAEEGVSIFVVSSFSTDHVLVKKENLEKAASALEKLGFVFVE